MLQQGQADLEVQALQMALEDQVFQVFQVCRLALQDQHFLLVLVLPDLQQVHCFQVFQELQNFLVDLEILVVLQDPWAPVDQEHLMVLEIQMLRQVL
jgi:hypothetical protein